MTILARRALLPLLAASALIAPAASAKCPTGIGEEPIVYGIGGSTMGTLLGPMLDKVLGEHHIEFSRWGKASSGLARPDFHDWPKLVAGLMDKHKPDVVVVSLGTNDYQPLFVKKGQWIRQEDADWEKVYAERVDEMLAGLSKDRPDRLIIWSGPYAFKGKNAVKRAPVVNRIMKARVEAFAAGGGNAVYWDAYALTADDDGTPLTKATLPNNDKPSKIRGHDGIHLTADAVRQLMAQPIAEVALPCFPSKATKAPAPDSEN